MAEAAAPSNFPAIPGMSIFTSFFAGSSGNQSQDTNTLEKQEKTTASALPSISGHASTTTPWLRQPKEGALKGSLRNADIPDRPASPTKSVMFRTSVEGGLASNDHSREGSFTSSQDNMDTRRKKRSSKQKTSYTICHAPPKSGSRHKIKVRARPLLQFHKVEVQGRPKPEFEVLPSAVFSPSLARAITKVFGTKHGLCQNDLAIVRAEKYHQNEESATDEDESRNVLAIVCSGRKGDLSAGQVKIIFANGAEWEGRQLPNGGYEYCNTDEHGLKKTVRWVIKRNVPKESDKAATPETSRPDSKKFNFSTISPNTRRHPVIANLCNNSLDICDFYTLPLPTTVMTPAEEQSPPMIRSTSEDSLQQDAIATTEDLRNLVTATSVWVAVREGWCSSFRYDEQLPRSPSGRMLQTSRTWASPPATPVSPRLPSDGEALQRSSSSLRQTLRASSLLRRHRTDDRPQSSHSSASTAIPSSVQEEPIRRRARADTTSTVLVHPVQRSRASTVDSFPKLDGERDEESHDDEEEGYGEGEDAKDVAAYSSPQAAPLPTLDANTEKRSNDLRSPTRPVSRKYDSSSTGSDGSDMEMQKATAKAQAKKDKKSKGNGKGKGFRKLFCGMF